MQTGTVEIRVNAAGDLRATRSTQFFVPPMGGQLTILSLANSGTAVKAGDVIAEFDASEQEFALEQANFELELANQEIAKAEAEAAVIAADDEVALLTARFNVRRAELDARANELVGSLVAQAEPDAAGRSARPARGARERGAEPSRHVDRRPPR